MLWDALLYIPRHVRLKLCELMHLKFLQKCFIGMLCMSEGIDMLAVIKTGGKQYKVKAGDFISVEKVSLSAGEKLEIKEVLLLNDGENTKIGTPCVEGASVTAEVIEHKKRKTVLVFKKSRRKNYRRKNGHRQVVTILKIASING